MLQTDWLILGALVLDWLLGDPYDWPHPVKCMGNYITWFNSLRHRIPVSGYIFGFLLWISTVGLSVFLTWLILEIAKSLSVYVFSIVWMYLAYTCLATKSLALEAQKVYSTLLEGTLQEARQQVGMIVGRDTSELTSDEIVKATVETVAENTSDGVIGPLFFLILGGPIWAIGYKAVNTLDSMVGYKTEKYREIGFVSAKMDDLLNLIPARLTWICMLLGTCLTNLDWQSAWKIGWRDRYQHASPNSAFSEAVVAGALGIKLGGPHIYHGQWVEKPSIGEDRRPARAKDIPATVHLLYLTVCIFFISYLLLRFFFDF